MAITDIFKSMQFKKEIEQLTKEIDVLKNRDRSIEAMSLVEIHEQIDQQKKTLEELKATTLDYENKVEQMEQEVEKRESKIKELEKDLIVTKEAIEMEGYGLYIPKYDFATSLGYKVQLDKVRQEQKEMIRNKSAVNYFDNWTVEGSRAKGKKMTNDNIRQILRSFNNECEAAINKVKYNNLHSIENRIMKSFEQLNKLNATNKVSLTAKFLDLKLAEMTLAYEYERKKQDEKEELREQREREREEKALQREIQNKKKIIDKDITHYQNMISDLENRLKQANNDEDKESIQLQIEELRLNINEREEEKAELDYRTAHASAGFVYIISNIGSFGEDVVKIGVTRRIDPLERINELSSASVPFKFDVHALIFSYDAYTLENELHKYFDKYRINRVNNRKEFFKVPIKKIEEKLEEYGELTIDFNSDPDAEEYRESL
ncbi:DUF4041 domain-containing protein [Brochothrix campestris]|uniref:Bacteriophage T5 Orf172 DNA-binding domain-containing protein n=1 Tax=Brochothrix campestris FSL F6-1037 TaxID=1265861 RepID=W7D1R7_9LIST|nr:DUF4041 domain-containing protein [Brochothrix campestris]EUJ41866.1 hypothetical protein BCAMP_01750 [Brochothrix campestris FSL F6-1037]